jgi:tRNA (Thr-GGU) A37 N-methylase/catechol 2,3-dioxygenase-like lactoylglutathione lyase family enzyme
MTVTRIDHVQLAMPVGGEPEATSFYEGLLGLTQVPKPESLAARGGCWFVNADVQLHLGVEAEFRPARKAHPALRVDDLDAITAHLRDAGVDVRVDEPLDGSARVFIDDPFGNRIELIDAEPSPSQVLLRPVGTVIGGRVEAIDDDWGAVEATILLDERFPDDCTAGLADYSHVDIVYVFDRVDPNNVHSGARHPRNRADWPLVGIFAQRAKARPNRLGVTTCELLDVDGLRLTVRGLDAIDGSPVIDVKPTMAEFLPRTDVRQPAWSHELMRHYWD